MESRISQNSSVEEVMNNILMELNVRDDAPELIEGMRELDWLEENPEFRERPSGFRDFCLSPHYLGLEGDMYRKLIDIGEFVNDGEFNEFIFKAGLGSGKSFLVSTLMCYGAHLLLCLKNPHSFYKLTDDKPITLIAMGIRETQVKRTVFSSIKIFIARSPFFRQFRNKIMVSSVDLDVDSISGGEFPRIEMACGNSSETAAIGLNLFMGIIDEADFFLDNDDKSDAEEIYSTITTRIASRFGRSGLAMAISSPSHEESFMNKKEIEAKVNPDTMYAISMPTWTGKDRERMEKDVFIFDSDKLVVLPKEGEYFDGSKKWNLPITPQKAKELKFATAALNDRFWIIPMDFYSAFKRNPERASRDLGAKSFRSNDVFIKLPSFVDQAFRKDVLNFAKPDKWDITPDLTDEPLYVHIDMGLNRETTTGQGDACGIAVGYFDDYDPASEGRPRIKMVALERILRSEITGEVNFRDVRARIFALTKAGYIIGKVTIDGWQSVDTIQTLNSQGIPCELLSVDTTVEPYESAKEAMYEKRLVAPFIPIVVNEFKHLQVIKAKKIDHPKKGSKDVADAVAGVVFSIIKDYGVDMSGEGGGGTLKFR